MKTHQLIELLTLQGQSHADTGGTDELAALAYAFDPHRDKSVATLVKQITKSMTDYADLTPQGAGLFGMLAQLASLRRILNTAGAKPAVKDLDALYAVLTPVAHASTDQLAVALRTATKLDKSTKSKAQPKTIDQSMVREIADRLTAANYDDQSFKSLLLDIRSRKLDKATVNAIANEFLGRDRTSKDQSIAKAFEAIEARHQLDNLSESRARKIESVNL